MSRRPGAWQVRRVLGGRRLSGWAAAERVAAACRAHLSGQHRQRLWVTPRNHLVPMAQPNPKAADRHHLRLWQARVLQRDSACCGVRQARGRACIHVVARLTSAAPHLIKVAARHMHLGRKHLQVLQLLLGAQVARAQDVRHLVGDLRAAAATSDA